MQAELGAIIEGKVTGITKFGAFVTMPGGTSGLVHISEIANTYVNDINEYLTVGQQVKVKVVGITPEGKINLSIKKAVDTPAHETRRSAPAQRQSFPRQNSAPRSAPRSAPGEVYGQTGDKSFEDKLKQFMQDSDSRMSGNRLYEKRPSKRRRD